MNKKKIVFILGGLFLILMIVFFVYKNKQEDVVVDVAEDVAEDKIGITTSFYPIYFLTSEIGGDLVNVENLTPAGSEPHDYELTAQDIVKIRKSQILFLNGGGLEVWSRNLNSMVGAGEPVVVVLGDGLMELGLSEPHEHEDEVGEEGQLEQGDASDHSDEEHAKDPHIWLSPALAVKMAEKIASELGRVDSKNYDYYKSNLNTLKTRLFELDNEYKLGLSNCKKKDFVTSHSAFGYLANEYNLRQISVAGISPEEEPSPRQLSKVAQFARENEVKYIFFESLISPRLSEVVANEIGAKTLVLNPIEGLTEEEIALGKNYITEMKANLENLKIALECD